MRAARLTALAAVLALAPAAARAASTMAQDKKNELGQVQKQLEATRKELEELRRQQSSLGRELLKLESRRGDTGKRVDKLKQDERSAERRRHELRARLLALGQASGYWKSSLEREARALARDLASRDDFYGRRDLWSDAYRRAAIIDKVELIAGLEGASRTAAQAEAETRRRAATMAQRARQAQREQDSAQREYEAKKAAMAQAQEKVAAATARAKELEESARALTRLIRSLREAAPKAGQPAQTARWDIPANSLLWPATGTVLKPFGRQRNPELNTWYISQGILLQTADAAAVTAVRAGKVIFCGPFRSYGQVMIVDHGSNFFSIYGELGATLKSKGDLVQPGEVIAKAGAPKSGGNGGRVYLEFRRGTEALDPLVWLRKH